MVTSSDGRVYKDYYGTPWWYGNISCIGYKNNNIDKALINKKCIKLQEAYYDSCNAVSREEFFLQLFFISLESAFELSISEYNYFYTAGAASPSLNVFAQNFFYCYSFRKLHDFDVIFDIIRVASSMRSLNIYDEFLHFETLVSSHKAKSGLKAFKDVFGDFISSYVWGALWSEEDRIKSWLTAFNKVSESDEIIFRYSSEPLFASFFIYAVGFNKDKIKLPGRVAASFVGEFGKLLVERVNEGNKTKEKPNTNTSITVFNVTLDVYDIYHSTYTTTIRECTRHLIKERLFPQFKNKKEFSILVTVLSKTAKDSIKKYLNSTEILTLNTLSATEKIKNYTLSATEKIKNYTTTNDPFKSDANYRFNLSEYELLDDFD